MTGKHFNFHRRWAVDLVKNTATHESGLLVTFTRHTDDGGGWDGAVDDANGNATFVILSAKHGAGNAAAMLPRLMREGAEVFSREKSKSSRL